MSKKFSIAKEVFNEASVEFPEFTEPKEKKLEQKCSKENISIEKVTFFL